ncbi:MULTISPECIES: hypothetical protein [Methylocaldum]|jgi:hypothetical protein|uniref:hypothetical protein n=1 Tax=unclassified Methylocaldum TaxID=2622260 RepID=UPI0012EB117F|nr:MULTISPECIES: hypothetical protein [unclassified Methylocaldum]MBP1151730.1 hypothetical protein [Methylocaldum sp. RMAD-M]MDV3242234.1 hypothetical protein [Methylocaldum sp.]
MGKITDCLVVALSCGDNKTACNGSMMEPYHRYAEIMFAGASAANSVNGVRT